MDLKSAFWYGLMVVLVVAFLDTTAGADITGQLIAGGSTGLQMEQPGLPGLGLRP